MRNQFLFIDIFLVLPIAIFSKADAYGEDLTSELTILQWDGLVPIQRCLVSDQPQASYLGKSLRLYWVKYCCV